MFAISYKYMDKAAWYKARYILGGTCAIKKTIEAKGLVEAHYDDGSVGTHHFSLFTLMHKIEV